jgi:hypothetical protein
MSQSHLTVDFPIKSPASAKALTEELLPLMPDFAKVQDSLATVHFSRFMVLSSHRVLQRYPGLSVLDIRALVADRKSQSATTA